jgi:6-phosphogluconolactonase (cycloisomerase 2 family)
MTMTIAWLTAMAAALACAPAAPAAPGKLVLQGCQSSPEGPAEPGCTPLEGLSYTGALGLSADGRSAYASFPNGVNVYSRDPATGELSFRECFNSDGAPPCAQIPGILGTAWDVSVPADGLSVYVAGGLRQTLIGFRRDPSDGGLTFVSCEYSSYGSIGDLPGCPVGPFQEAREVESSPDGRAVYLADRGCADNTGECFVSVLAYERDPQTSVLTFRDRGSPATSGGGPFALEAGVGNVYHADSKFGTISVFKRVGAATLKRVQCIRPSKQRACRRARRMGRARALALSPNGKLLVTAANPKRGASWLAVFERARNGKLSFRERIKDARLRSTDQLEFGPDGRSLYAVSGAGEDSFLLRFKLNPKRGKIAFAQCLSSAPRDGCSGVPQLRGLSEVATVARSVYAVASDPDVAGGLNAVVRFGAQE